MSVKIDSIFRSYRRLYPSTACQDIELMRRYIRRNREVLETSRDMYEVQYKIERGSSSRAIEWSTRNRNVFNREGDPINEGKSKMLNLGVPANVALEALNDMAAAALSAISGEYIVANRFHASLIDSLAKKLPILGVEQGSRWGMHTTERNGRKYRAQSITIDLSQQYTTIKASRYLSVICGGVMSELFGDVALTPIRREDDNEGPMIHDTYCWRINDWCQVFLETDMLDAKKGFMVCPPKDFRLDAHNRCVGGGYLTDYDSTLLSPGKSDKVELREDFSVGEDYVCMVNSVQKIPIRFCMDSLDETLRLYKGGDDELVCESLGLEKELHRFSLSLKEESWRFMDLLRYTPADHNVWDELSISLSDPCEKRGYNNSDGAKSKTSKKHDTPSNVKKLRDTRWQAQADIENTDAVERKAIILEFLERVCRNKIRHMVDHRRSVWWPKERERCRRALITLIVAAASWPNQDLYYPIKTDQRGRFYPPGDTNHVNSKLTRRMCYVNTTTSKDSEGPENNPYMHLYVASQVSPKKIYSMAEAWKNIGLSDVYERKDLIEVCKLLSWEHTGRMLSVGFDATSSVFQHLSSLSGDTKLAALSNMQAVSEGAEDVLKECGKDVYTHLGNTIKLDPSIPEHIKGLASSRGFLKTVSMKWGYSSQPGAIAMDICNDRSDKLALWPVKLVAESAKAVIQAFKNEFPSAHAFKESVESYGEEHYFKNKGMLIALTQPTQNISYRHNEQCLYTTDVHAFIPHKNKRNKIESKKIRVEIEMYQKGSILPRKGRSSTLVNLIHSIDARVLLSARVELCNKGIATQGIHDCFLCQPQDIKNVVRVYYDQATLYRRIDVEKVLPGYKYPHVVVKSLSELRSQGDRISLYCLMPT